MICFVVYGVNTYVSKHKFNSFVEKKLDSNDFSLFLWKFSLIQTGISTRIRIRNTGFKFPCTLKIKTIAHTQNEAKISPTFGVECYGKLKWGVKNCSVIKLTTIRNHF